MIERAASAINSSTLPASTRANAFALLAMVHPDNGLVCLEWQDITAAFRVKTAGGAREHLTRMQHSGLIHYSTDPTDDTVTIRFKAFAPRAAQKSTRARVDFPHGHAILDSGWIVGEPKEDAVRVDLTRGRVDLTTPPHTRPVGELQLQEGRQEGDPSLPSLPDAREDETPDPETAQDTDPDEELQADIERSVALLTDREVGCDEAFARALAREFPFKEIRRQVFRFRRDFSAGSVVSVGALRKRLQTRWAATITTEDKKSLLWQRHETEGDRRKRYDPFYQEESQ